MKKSTAVLICTALGIGLFAAIFPYNHDMYIPPLFTVICAALNGVSCLLFALILYRLLRGTLSEDSCKTFLWLLVISGLGHEIFAMMNWGSWVCLGLSLFFLAALVKKLMDGRKKRL